MASILASVAAGVHEANKAKRAIKRQQCIDELTKLFRNASDRNEIAICLVDSYEDFLFGLEIDYTLDASDPAKDWTAAEARVITHRAVNQAFGSPMLTYQQKELRQHCTQYYNPTAYHINVEPMGIPDEEGNVIKQVVPGGILNVPTPYAVGGKRSVVHSSAPQLKPCPITQAYDNLLDMTPVSYTEWLAYHPYQNSRCCNKPIHWSDRRQALVCPKCLGILTLPKAI